MSKTSRFDDWAYERPSRKTSSTLSASAFTAPPTTGHNHSKPNRPTCRMSGRSEVTLS